MIKGIIFDFDGVIVQSVKVKSDAFAELYKLYGSEIVKKVIIHHEKNGGLSRFKKIKYYHESFLNKSITNEEISILANKFSNIVIDEVINCPYVPGAFEYIEKVSNHYKLFVSTGTPTYEINKILKSRKIDGYFTEVFGSPQNKSTHLTVILEKYNFHPNELIFYGDSNSDLDAAQQKKIPFILIKNKYNTSISDLYKGKIINNFMELI